MKKADKLEAIERIVSDWCEWSEGNNETDRGTLFAILSVCGIKEDDDDE